MKEAADRQASRRFDIRRLQKGRSERIIDTVASEEPLQIRIAYHFKDQSRVEPLALTMRTPGHDRQLAAGFLLTEGIIQTRRDLADLRLLGTGADNEVIAELRPGVDVESWRLARTSFIGASCGICGKRSREAMCSAVAELEHDEWTVDYRTIENLPNLLLGHQQGFEQTGGLHAAALVDPAGELQMVFEDIGRHNALDKLIGHCVLEDILPLRQSIVLLSSRSSFELIQKAAMAGVPVLATIGGPSSLAIEAARDCGITLLGFVRGERFNVYSGEWRVAGAC
ncbi:MAG TPA: formate dehydrogenase accessory sulfurtransferase FdhD [Bryobacteraceae bacterium]|nr:formate dehydrogenase accessory sulfurtransferase FdhD [Bryobacteraceae bacterium]